MRALKTAGGVVAGLLLIVIVAAAVLAIDGGHVLAWVIEQPVSHLAGRQIRVDGPVTIEWGEPTRIIARDIHIANARWGSRPDFLVAQRVAIEIDPRTLLKTPARLALISFDRALLLLETSRDGERNWDFALERLGAEGRRLPQVSRLVVHDGIFLFHNGRTGTETGLGAGDLAIDAPDPSGPVHFTTEGTFRNQPMRLAATTGPLGALHDPTRPYPVDLEARLGESRLAVAGTATEPLDLAGIDARLSFSGRKLRELADSLGATLPPLPDINAAGTLKGGHGKWAVDALTLGFGRSDVEGGIALDIRGAVPYARADLAFDLIDPADVIGVLGHARPGSATEVAPQSGPAGRVIPPTPVALRYLTGMLPDINADVSLSGGRIAGGGTPPLDRFVARLHVKDGALALTPLTFGLGGGDVALDMSFKMMPLPPRATLDLDLHHVDLAKLLKDAALPDYVKETRGVIDGFAHLRSAGMSLRDFAGNMSGTAGVGAENGLFSPLTLEILDRGVLQSLGLYASDDQPVAVNCLVSRFDIREGVATATALQLDGPDTTLVGNGVVNFAAETIYLDLTPRHKRVTPLTRRTPAELRGTFARPTLGLAAASTLERPGAGSAAPSLPGPAGGGLAETDACGGAPRERQPAEPAVGSSRPQKR